MMRNQGFLSYEVIFFTEVRCTVAGLIIVYDFDFVHISNMHIYGINSTHLTLGNLGKMTTPTDPFL